jgi:hypothetical protein
VVDLFGFIFRGYKPLCCEIVFLNIHRRFGCEHENVVGVKQYDKMVMGCILFELNWTISNHSVVKLQYPSMKDSLQLPVQMAQVSRIAVMQYNLFSGPNRRERYGHQMSPS